MADLKRRRRAMPEPEDVEDEPAEAAEPAELEQIALGSWTTPEGRQRLLDEDDEAEEQRLEQMFGQANADGERAW